MLDIHFILKKNYYNLVSLCHYTFVFNFDKKRIKVLKGMLIVWYGFVTNILPIDFVITYLFFSLLWGTLADYYFKFKMEVTSTLQWAKWVWRYRVNITLICVYLMEFSFYPNLFSLYFVTPNIVRSRCDRVVVGFTTTYAISALSPLTLCVEILLMARGTWYNILW